ncbi:Cation efflux system protein CzcB [Legionella massiliensis]|uniref:Cation efflux system protein CzcB n=1 Tax=Legionella massiliensis TaxID=1034943 RepID=A0A078KWL9_9GAMM|nr:efflux RND transporter periplasmic adaptor subunit [Legionella massiliensis]CDZ76108.1 Cation efflux system protein CzcB [Legionella massiliensis]CEE11846.1 Cobalt-zinc-cadmium resistance protein CzcB [Legionella massiliensis]
MKNLALLIFISLCLLSACSSPVDQKKNQTQTYVVKTESMHKNLFFTGTIQPLHESTLTSPMDAIVETMHYHYGQQVKKGEVVFTLNSSELQKQYNDILTEYLKAKDSYTIAQAKFTGTQDLWNAGLLSKNNFLSEKSSLATARVSLMQAAGRLTAMLEKMDDKGAQNLSKLSIAEFDKVRQALTGNHNLIKLKAPGDGVILYPPKSGEDKPGKLSVGSALKSGQIVALVGDLSGVSVEIDIPEIDIDKIHTGMRAKVTGIALGKHVLEGELVAVNAQASSHSGSNLPSFSAVVEVKHLNELQRPWVKVGMSASIEIEIDSDKQLLVPIAALKQEKGRSIVKLQTKDGSTDTRIVSTGAALADKVVIAAGLRAGDVVVYD